MKCLKISCLAVIVAGASMAFAGSAPAAPTLTSPAGTEYTGPLNGTASSSLLFKAVFSNVTCLESTMSVDVTTNNTEHASGPLTAFTLRNCGSTDIVVATLGSLTINQKTEVLGPNTVVSFQNTSTGAHCAFGTGTNTKLGTFSQSQTNTTAATITISASLPYSAAHSTTSQFACGTTQSWSGSYTITTPVPLFSV